MNPFVRTSFPFILFWALTGFAAHAALPLPPAPQINARAWLLIDVSSGQPLAEKAADTRMEPASLTKIMTAYLSFAALKDGRLKLDQTLPVSERAWQAEGSRTFLVPGRPARVEDLLRGMIIQSGNDASIALAEGIGGSEEGFVAMMNRTAQRLGMTNTHFTNATGLPHAQHHSTARDLARLTMAMIRDFPERYKLYAEKDFAYNGIRQPNRNRLLYMDPSVDGVKTGHTGSAGYCLVASSQRDQRRLLSVVLGANSDVGRAMESQKLLNYGFQFYETVKLYPAGRTVSTLRIYKGADSALRAGFGQDLYVTVPRGTAQRLKAQVVSRQPMLAPVRRGQAVGSLRLSLDGERVGDFPLRALHDIPVAGLLGRAWDSLLLLFR
ncbi:MAG TPA: D-alanyl-D-alanine carboxypeptidase family protein [Thiobacillaceae bacterium]|nr:D-alanyl-D-alanine carboxypeptidase family protein [Thiobacillaceae bacterium]HNU63803.1 D-alanyl-D-alanine carboxypeptidase family protein [Thiobacillaceae bacterium]